MIVLLCERLTRERQTIFYTHNKKLAFIFGGLLFKYKIFIDRVRDKKKSTFVIRERTSKHTQANSLRVIYRLGKRLIFINDD